MNIAINALTIRKGGSVTTLQKLLGGFLEIGEDHQYQLIANGALRDAGLPRDQKVHYHYFAWAEHRRLLTVLWYLIVLPAWLRRNRIDVLFSHTCYLPFFGTTPCALLVQDAGFFADRPDYTSPLLSRTSLAWRRRWAHYSVRIADNIAVQTQTLADWIIARIPEASPRLKVIRHGPGFLAAPCETVPRVFVSGQTLEIICIGYFRDYKNFSVLLPALHYLRNRNIRARLHLTLNAHEPGVINLVREAEVLGVTDMLVNHGELDTAGVTRLYRAAHLCVFPSVYESFGFPQVEAMAFGLQVIAADTPVSREVCQNAAVYFPPHDASALADLISHFYFNPAQRQGAADVSLRRAADFDWLRAAQETLLWLQSDIETSNPPHNTKPSARGTL